ncbi:aminoglycoside phosphotransferase family protein [Georgenia sp. MJ170]|uniref:aminoglycoside phosphotransferase family protein n=1 Tax=Georgenia sunbinii TaxID=3117728 RepID=UPI002F269E49
MWHEAVAWAELLLETSVTQVARLEGGLTSTMLELTGSDGRGCVLRLMTEEPWRTHGAALTAREAAAQRVLARTPVPAPLSIGLDADGHHTGVAAHLMTRLPGRSLPRVDGDGLGAMARMLATIHEVSPAEPFRTYQSWAPWAKWTVPVWSRYPASWRRAFEVLEGGPPPYEPTFLHRDYSHRNLLWDGSEIVGVVDWVETSTGPAWLDAAHAATNLAVVSGPGPAHELLARYAALTARPVEPYWLVMDAVGFLPPPGRPPLFGSARELEGLDRWLHDVVTGR